MQLTELTTRGVFLKQRVAYTVRQELHFWLFQKQCRGSYRLRYTYFSNLVARTRLSGEHMPLLGIL